MCGADLGEVWATAVDVEYGTSAERFRYLRCASCDALSIDPLPDDRLPEIYPPTYYSFATGGELLDPDRNLVTKVKAALDKRSFARALRLAGAPPRPRVLDIGGGSGGISGRLIASVPGATATVVDIDPATIEVARRRGLGGFVGRIEEFETEERFDLVLLLNLIEHVADPGAVLRRAGELLTPNGVLWIQTPNYDSLDARLFRERNWTGLHCPRHWVVFGSEGLRRAVAASGLIVAEAERAQAGSFWASSLLAQSQQRRGGIATARGRPLATHPAFLPLAALAAAFDIGTRRWRQTSQQVVFVRRAPV